KSLESDISVEESPVAEADSDESGSPAENCLSEDPFAVVDDFATEEEPVVEETAAVEEPAAVEESPVAEADSDESGSPAEVSLSEDPFAVVDDFATDEEPVVEESSAVEESPAVEEPAAVEESPAEDCLSEDPFAVVDDFATDEEPVVEETAAVEEPAAVEESPAEDFLSEDPFAVVDDFATDEEPVVSEYKQIIKKIEEKLSDPEAAKTNAEQIELFKSLKVLASCMPDNQKDSYISCKIRMVLEYLIAKLSGRPGLLITAEALLESGVLGQEYSSKLEETSDEDLSNELIKHVITYMKKLAGQLEDSALSSALCTSADSILEKIELENSKSQIF
ncbi:MAG: hypothetical protein MST05_12500, partial [Treponema sp.]|nr:hypothetical protein [Treponema sp.]